MSATCTAQITVGHLSHGWYSPEIGIGPNRVLYLVEGARAAWVLESVAHAGEEEPGPPITWVPRDPEHILADALVMIAALVDQDPGVLKLIEERLKGSSSLLEGDWADLTELDGAALEELEAAACGAVRSKLVITVMNSSSIAGQLALFDRCSMEAEVCTVSWVRQKDAEGKEHVAGTLPPEAPEAHRFYEVRI